MIIIEKILPLIIYLITANQGNVSFTSEIRLMYVPDSQMIVAYSDHQITLDDHTYFRAEVTPIPWYVFRQVLIENHQFDETTRHQFTYMPTETGIHILIYEIVDNKVASIQIMIVGDPDCSGFALLRPEGYEALCYVYAGQKPTGEFIFQQLPYHTPRPKPNPNWFNF